MKTVLRSRSLLNLLPALALALTAAAYVQAQNAPQPTLAITAVKPVDAGTLWKPLSEASVHPQPPVEWRTKRPDQGQFSAWIGTERERLKKLAAGLLDFQTRFPKDANAGEATTRERQVLVSLSQWADSDAEKRLSELEAVQLKNPSVTPQERFEIRRGQVERAGRRQNPEEREKAVRELIKEFPNSGDAYAMLLPLGADESNPHTKALAEEVIKSSASEDAKSRAKSLLKKIDAVGKPLDIKFTALDGRDVDLAKMKGKVILIDFWATWCGPCVGEIPHVKAAYSKLHEKGFEVIGLSFDGEKGKLEQFVKEKEMTWPQYFDGKGWQNKYGVEFGIHGIPTMWLVDKKGNLRDLSARTGLEGKVQKLLAE